MERDQNFNLIDPELRSAFELAAREVDLDCGCVDGGLHTGMLDVSDCADVIKQFTGCNPYDPISLISPSYLLDKWTEDRPYVYIEDWAIQSTKKFLELCKQFGLSVRFEF